MEKNLTTYEKCETIRNHLLRKMGEVLCYKESWGIKFSMEEIYNLPNIIKEWEEEYGSFAINPCDLTDEEMQKLGFGKFTKDDKTWLIPIWLYPFLADEFESKCIDDKQIFKKKDMNTDHRFGYLAYSVMPKEK